MLVIIAEKIEWRLADMLAGRSSVRFAYAMPVLRRWSMASSRIYPIRGLNTLYPYRPPVNRTSATRRNPETRIPTGRTPVTPSYGIWIIRAGPIWNSFFSRFAQLEKMVPVTHRTLAL